MQEDMEIPTRGTPHQKLAFRLRVGVAAAAVLVACFAAAPFAAASVPQSASGHAAAITAVVPPQWPHWGCPVQGTAPSARVAPTPMWPHWGCPLNGLASSKPAPASLWPHWGGPVHGAQAFWPHWGGPVR
jgi:hypothetical protein